MSSRFKKSKTGLYVGIAVALIALGGAAGIATPVRSLEELTTELQLLVHTAHEPRPEPSESQQAIRDDLLGPLDGLGIRDGASATFVGGLGCMRAAVVRLDLASLRPFVGLAAESVAGDIEIEPPPGGVAVVENFAVFEACCRGEVSGLKDTLVVWAAGYPGRAVKAVIQAASRTRAAVRIWADLDLDGVRIVRLVAEWFSGAVEPFDSESAAIRFACGERNAIPVTIVAA